MPTQIVELLDTVWDLCRADDSRSRSDRFSDGAPAYVLERDAAGGEYLRPAPVDSSPVFFADSEGQAGLLAPDVARLFGLIVALPYPEVPAIARKLALRAPPMKVVPVAQYEA